MKIAVASQNFRTVTSHAGKTRRFLVFQAESGTPPLEIARIELSKEMSMHEFHSDGPHPLYDMDAIIAGSAGPGFFTRLHAKGVSVAVTSETDPSAAVNGFLTGTLPPAEPHHH